MLESIMAKVRANANIKVINMKVIHSNNVNHGLQETLFSIGMNGVKRNSRNGMVLKFPTPMTIVHKNPMDHVLVSPHRRINPYLHFFEPLWILAHRNDVRFLAQFTKQMKEYSDDGVIFNAGYGYRIKDQLKPAIQELSVNPESRQVNLQIWDWQLDLCTDTKDKACNMMVNLQVNSENRLDITVFNRSNDILWGCFGTNVVQFSTLQAYIAANLDIPIGTYYQVSTNLHLYIDTQKSSDMAGRLLREPVLIDKQHGLEGANIMPEDIESGFDDDLSTFFNFFDEGALKAMANHKSYSSPYFRHVVTPIWKSWIDQTTIRPGMSLETQGWAEAVKIWRSK